MSTVVDELRAHAKTVQVTPELLVVELTDGRVLSVPLVWFPRLWYGTPEERAHFEILGDGEYIHWSQLDEDISVASLLLGRRSAEAPASLRRWLAQRGQAAGDQSG